jgi:hypothetical protein
MEVDRTLQQPLQRRMPQLPHWRSHYLLRNDVHLALAIYGVPHEMLVEVDNAVSTHPRCVKRS